MFAVLDNTDLPSLALLSSNTMNETSYMFALISIPKLRNTLVTLKIFSNASTNLHLPLDTEAPRSICSAEWLQKANWKPLKRKVLSTNTQPFRFAGHPVCALYDVWPAAAAKDFEGKNHISKIFSYFCPSNTTLFYLISQINADLAYMFDYANVTPVIFQPRLSTRFSHSW